MLLIAYLKSGMFSLILAISITAWTGTGTHPAHARQADLRTALYQD